MHNYARMHRKTSNIPLYKHTYRDKFIIYALNISYMICIYVHNFIYCITFYKREKSYIFSEFISSRYHTDDNSGQRNYECRRADQVLFEQSIVLSIGKAVNEVHAHCHSHCKGRNNLPRAVTY